MTFHLIGYIIIQKSRKRARIKKILSDRCFTKDFIKVICKCELVDSGLVHIVARKKMQIEKKRQSNLKEGPR